MGACMSKSVAKIAKPSKMRPPEQQPTGHDHEVKVDDAPVIKINGNGLDKDNTATKEKDDDDDDDEDFTCDNIPIRRRSLDTISEETEKTEVVGGPKEGGMKTKDINGGEKNLLPEDNA